MVICEGGVIEARLTRREHEIMLLAADMYTSAEIGEQLLISANTV